MISIAEGDILRTDAEALVNTVNCVGYMGRGIALQFKRAFPDNFKAYESACRHQEVRPGSMFVFSTGQLTNPRYVINFPTKRHWRGASRLADIDSEQLELIPGAVDDANRILATNADTKARFARVADLVEGFETPFGMELLATVHWVGTREGAKDPAAATKGIYAWNDRKRCFSPEQIRVAWETLSAKGWLSINEGQRST